MRRLITGTLLAVALVTVAVVGVGASDGAGGSNYTVHAIFDDAAAAVPGEDVKVAGAKVGSIGKMELTPEKKASIELKIEDSGFQPFHEDAHCTIRPQSLIGEKYVECEPGTSSSPELGQIPDGRPGAGQYLLTLKHTSAPVDLDLVNNVLRLPYRQRFAIILNELGAGLAGRGEDLNEVIHRANPALRETGEVLRQLAAENRTLRDLASDSDRALAPLARDRRHLGGFIEHANTVGEATAERRADIERSIQRLPEFLRQLKPTMEDLGALSDEMTPVLTDLGDSAQSLSRFVLQLGPFSRSSQRALESLGDAADVGGPVLQRARPVVLDLKSFAHNARPVSEQLDAVTKSLDETGGLEQFMNYVFFQMTAINGFDAIGHYLRAELIANTCSTYSTEQAGQCSAHFTETKSVQSSASSAEPAKASAAASRPHRTSATSTKATPVTQLKGLLNGLLQLNSQRRVEGEGAGAAGIQRIRAQANAGVSPALRDVGGSDAALLGYLMGNDQ